MGVTDLIPFLTHRFPRVVLQLPDRLQQLRGKTAVIDATLITFRFHFSPTEHTHRHIQGWYRLISELRESGINPICVFDGTMRSMAKAAESERRKASARLAQSRSLVEEGRYRRFRSIGSVLHALSKAHGTLRRDTASALAESLSASPPLETVFPVLESIKAERAADTEMSDTELHDVLLQQPGILTEETIPGLGDMDAWRNVFDPALDSITVDISSSSSPSVSALAVEPSPPEIALSQVPKLVKQLHSDFYHSVHKLDMSPIFAPSSVADAGSVVDKSISKRQTVLVAEEHEFWRQLLDTLSSNRPLPPIRDKLASMETQSLVISKSFDKQLDPPTKQTHAESKHILRIMGVPVLETDGPFEAEGLASSIVRHGHADYVVSEDTDVLVYQAPLLRHVTSRTGPLSLIDGAEVRKALELSDASFIDFALLLGTDFTERIPQVGPTRALKFMQKHGSIENILAKEKSYPPRGLQEDYLQRVRLGREVFNTLPPPPPGWQLKGFDPQLGELETLLKSYNLHTDEDVHNKESIARLGSNIFNDQPAHEDGKTFIPFF